MISRRPVFFWLSLCGLALVGLLSVAAVPAQSEDKPADRAKEIADLEKQIQELTRKLNELKKNGETPTSPAVEPGLPADWVKQLNWRCIGPAAMGGRITALAVYEADPSTYWVATASGGLLKTTNAGTTFVHQFDRENTVSIGDVAVAQSNPNIVWVGTGENNPRNSVSYGDGVYKSIDGGKTWKNMGLQKTFQIGRIAIHPKDPNIVYVGALGRLYGPNVDRGLFKTTDGGKTWEKVLYVDDKTGVIDVQMHPTDPNTLLVATWERQRDGFDSHPGDEMPPADGYDRYDPIKKWGPGTGIYKTTDGGKTFNKLKTGLPTVAVGRISIDYYRKNPNTIYAIIDTEKGGMGTPPTRVYIGVQTGEAPDGVKLTSIADKSPAAKAGLKTGDVIKAVDKKEVKNNNQLGEQIRAHKAGDKITLTIQRDKESKDIEVTLEDRPYAIYIGAGAGEVEGTIHLTNVDAKGPADKAGLKLGDELLSIDGKEIKSLRNAFDAMRGHAIGDKVNFKVKRGNDVKEFVVTLEKQPGGDSKRPYGFGFLSGQRENVQTQQGPDSHQYGGVFKSTDGGESWTRINSLNPRPMYFGQVRVDPSDDKYLYVLGISLYRSNDGGKTFQGNGGNGVHPDQHALWIDPKDGRHMIVGCDGGFYATHDRMAHWDFLNQMAIGQFYHVAVDSRRPYRVYGGLQDNGSWGGPSRSLSGRGPINEDWVTVAGGDGFVCRVDPNDPELVYFESQDGHIGRRNLKTGRAAGIRARDPEGKPPYRYNWNTPFILSSHNSNIFYCAGNHVFRSLKQGDDLRVISPDITRTKRGTATALAESPRNAEVLYAGTDDGFLWVTRDGGAKWTNITPLANAMRQPPNALPGPRWVASIEPSREVEGRAYVVFDGHRSDDDEPYVFVTEDFGATWKSLRANLPTGSTRVLREDITNHNLLYLGTEFAAWASVNRGVSWTKINNNLPTVAVHEFAIHPTAGEIVAATHGRSLWVLDVTPLRHMTAEALKAPATLYQPNSVVRWRNEPGRGSMYGTGSRNFAGQNPPFGAQIFYSLTKKADKATLKIVDYSGKTVMEANVTKDPGLHRVVWNMTRTTMRTRQFRINLDADAMPRRPAGGIPVTTTAAPGMYRVVLTVDGKEQSQGLRIEADPTLPQNLIADEEEVKPEKPKKDDDDDEDGDGG
jgi:photosystem II stability/assembly factor-like uncharacterized protein